MTVIKNLVSKFMSAGLSKDHADKYLVAAHHLSRSSNTPLSVQVNKMVKFLKESK